jgi:DNA-binding SARP family transcriptional activator
MLELRLLGSLEVRDGERTISIPRPKQRALLAALALEAGRVISKDQLIDRLWGDQAPARADHALENYVSQLRKLLGDSVIVTRAPGYVLAVEPEQVDSLRFERMIAEAHAAPAEERAAKLEQALASHRGPPLTDLAYEPFASAEVARLEELELSAREGLIEVRLEMGWHAQVVPELEQLVARAPYRERLCAMLMLALYRSGRQADALAVYKQARDVLVEGLGIEPGEELRELERAILVQDASLRAPTGAERGAPRTAARARPARKTVSVLVALLAGVSRDPEALRAERDRSLEVARCAIERHGGRFESSLGDTIAGVFGVAASREDDAQRAVQAASELRDELVQPAVRIGVATGEVYVRGEPGEVLSGEPFSSAEQLARAGLPGEIRIAEATRRLAEERRLRFDSPLVGRSRQLAVLEDAFAATVSGRSCQLFTLLGAAGVGKSRLVEEFVQRLGANAAILRGRCLSHGEAITFAPLIEALGGAAGLDELSEPPDVSPLDSLVLSREDAVTVEARRSEVLRLIDDDASAEEVANATRSFVEASAGRRPLVVVFDDLHWGKPNFLDLVEHVVERSRSVPLLLVGSARPELLDERRSWGGGKLNARSLLLEPLSDQESEELVDNLLGAGDLAPIVRSYIVQTAGGNPLFVEELLGSLIDQAVLRRQDGVWTTGELPALAMPPSIRALLAARIDRLPDEQRLVLELASIEGRRFHDEAVVELAPAELRDEVAGLLSVLVRRDLILPRAGRQHSFSFRHQLLRDAAYDTIPKHARVELHERFADWLERRAGAGVHEVEDILTYHRDQADRFRVEIGFADHDR